MEAIKTNQSKDEILTFIRKKLSFYDSLKSHIRHTSINDLEKEHLRFEMSGYESVTGECTVNNLKILNRFAYLGIYDYTDYLFLDFYKGSPVIYLRYFGSSNSLEFELSGYTTSEIIYKIFELTIFSGKGKRRR
jgi:hypothetical protein